MTTLLGPIYNVPLIDTLPLGKVGFSQAMPSRDDLERVRKLSPRTAAGYEVLLAHYTRVKARAASLESVAKAFVDYYPSGINPDLDAAYVLARKLIEESTWTERM